MALAGILCVLTSLGMILSTPPINTFAPAVIKWHAQFGRKNLPWQINPTPYRVWVSEIMLQQTQVITVLKYYDRFMSAFPTLKDLALAEQDSVLALWSGLGYYARARNMHKAAGQVQEKYGGELPCDITLLQELSGIGRSTAGAILSLSDLAQPHPILDGNVKRVLARYFAVDGWPGMSLVLKKLWDYSEKVTPVKDTKAFNQAMMDIGSLICSRSKPLCEQCPVQTDCKANVTGNYTAYPGKKPKKQIPIKTTTMLLLEDMDTRGILLHKRPSSGIWGGLWSFPQFETNDVKLNSLLAEYNVIEIDSLVMPSFRHTFSHYHLDIQPIKVKVKRNHAVMDVPDQVWYKEGPLPGGIATPVSRLLAMSDSGHFELTRQD